MEGTSTPASTHRAVRACFSRSLTCRTDPHSHRSRKEWNKGLSLPRNTVPARSKGEFQVDILDTMMGLQEAIVRQKTTVFLVSLQIKAVSKNMPLVGFCSFHFRFDLPVFPLLPPENSQAEEPTNGPGTRWERWKTQPHCNRCSL